MAYPIHQLNPAGDHQIEGHVTAKQNLRLYSDTAYLGTLDHAITAARTWTLPNASGMLALTSDVVTDHGALTGLGDDDHTQYGLKAGTLAQFAATTSLQLFGVISDETGSGVLVGSDSPTFTTKIVTPLAFFNDTANTKMVYGVTIRDTGASSRESIAFKHDGLAHGVTARTETDTAAFMGIQEWSNGLGGFLLEAFRASGGGHDVLSLYAWGGSTGDQTKTASAEGRLNFRAGEFNGTDVTNPGANDNILVVGGAEAGTVRLLLDYDGDLYLFPSSGTGALISAGGESYFMGGNVGIGITDPAALLHLHAATGANADIRFSDADVAHGMTDIVPTSVWGLLQAASSTAGGWEMQGFASDVNSPAFVMKGTVGGASSTIAAIQLLPYKKSGTGRVALATTDLAWEVKNADTTALLKQNALGHLIIGTGALPSGGGPAYVITDGSDPSGIGANTAGVYAKDVTGTTELFGFDEAGNFPQLTPHPNDFLNTLPLENRPYPWAYSSINYYLGKKVQVDMAGLLSLLVLKAGANISDFVHVSDVPTKDWDTDQEANNQRRITEQMQWDESEAVDKGPRPPDYIKKRPPLWMERRGVRSML